MMVDLHSAYLVTTVIPVAPIVVFVTWLMVGVVEIHRIVVPLALYHQRLCHPLHLDPYRQHQYRQAYHQARHRLVQRQFHQAYRQDLHHRDRYQYHRVAV